MKKSTNVLNEVVVCEILIVGALLKKSHEKIIDIVKSLCANLLYTKKKVCTPGFLI